MTADELTCRELVQIVTDYLEGRMDPGERIRFEKHLVFCDGCVIYVDQMRDTIRVAGAIREEQVPEEARDALLEAFRSWRRG